MIARGLRFLLIGFLLGGNALRAAPAITSTTGPEIVKAGNYELSNWRSDDFKGAAQREWDPATSTFRFIWKTEGGDQIGRIGSTYGSPRLGRKVSEIKPGTMMSTKAIYTQSRYGWFYWSVYGWTNPKYTYWGDTPHGWNNEFYVIFYTDKPRSDFLADKTEIDIGSVTVDGAIFDCYKTPRTSQSQFLAVARNKTWSASVDLKPIFDYWRAHGMDDEYVVDLGWALEGFAGSDGKLELTQINIPDLAPASK